MPPFLRLGRHFCWLRLPIDQFTALLHGLSPERGSACASPVRSYTLLTSTFRTPHQSWTADEQKQLPDVLPPHSDIAVYFADDTVILAAYWALACTVDETH